MYNEELKRRFISERKSEATLPENYLERSFKQSESLEEKLGKDLCNFTYYEIVELYKRRNTTSIGVLQVLNSQLSIYTDWCQKQNLVTDNQNHFLEIRLEDYYSCINKAMNNLKIISREDVMRWVNTLPNACEQFILLALFEGLKGKSYCDIVLLKEEHLHGNMVKLPSTGEMRQISDTLVEIIHDCQEQKNYYCLSEDEEKTTRLIESGYIIKNQLNVINDDPVRRGGRIRRSIKIIFKYLGIDYLRLNDIYESGRIHFIKTEMKKYGLSLAEYINSEHCIDYEKIYGKIVSKPSFLKKYEGCL